MKLTVYIKKKRSSIRLFVRITLSAYTKDGHGLCQQSLDCKI